MFIGKPNSLVTYNVLASFIFKDIFPSFIIHEDSYYYKLNRIIFLKIIGNTIDISPENIPFSGNFSSQAKQFLNPRRGRCISVVTPQTRGSIDYSSTRGIQVDVGLPNATSENWAESPLYGELYPITTPARNLFQAVQYNYNMSKTTT